ncbi:cytidylyltransferase domain-containing protein [Epilithonimonas xixisoli]|uniref:N-acylneuraminate cytidylyltransferase/CMP-N,N'-diacetyllegionaminic acid synthase n=1 Tax=Epilithonimonas xixisoli TaxID=1476462 RepID=A0A4R8IEE0_9FLAO|nr:acylneuraminate cytidylyltransferase family protein [Epilithonimonas xixisoli]TDX84098.1 N-acylneuraminate cytidylyltransferase/CMP-N,N'-diacetyllegionaminic acid synthase [Epilithonimonas xixisoli]
MIAIIPARGGSKGLPGKNIKLLNGKPLIAYTIDAALNAKKISRVIVSTDDAEIAEIAKNYGAEIPFMRPDFLANDNAKSIDVYNYTIERLETEENTDINEIVVLQPTSPLRTAQHIDEAIDTYLEKNADSVISYCKEDHPIFWHKFITEDGKFEEIFSNDYQKNRQDIRSTYHPNGAIYILKKDVLLSGNYYNEGSYAYIMDKNVSIDIDTQEDFELAQWQMTKKEQ